MPSPRTSAAAPSRTSQAAATPSRSTTWATCTSWWGGGSGSRQWRRASYLREVRTAGAAARREGSQVRRCLSALLAFVPSLIFLRLHVGADAAAAPQPPKFDPDLVAELVIRIMTTRPKPATAALTAGAAAVKSGATATAGNAGDRAADAAPSNATDRPGPGTGPKLGPAPRNRLAKIQASAARARDKPGTGAVPEAPVVAEGGATPGTMRVPSALSRVVGSFPVDTGGASGSAPPPEGAQSGEAILVFLSGIQAINRVSRALRQRSVLQRLRAEVGTEA
jgi:hypothetical protein